MPARSAACTSRARTRRCRTPTSTMPAQALAKLEHLVVQDLFLTETAFHADVVLPASAFAEKAGTFTNTDRRVQIGRPVVPPPGDARQDLVDHPGDRPAHRPRLELSPARATSSPRWRQVMPSLQQHHLGAPGARGRRDLSGRRRRTSPGNEIIFTPASRPRAAAAGSCRPTSLPPDEVPGRRLSRWCSRPAASSSTGTPAR